jgi:hypothetical protein
MKVLARDTVTSSHFLGAQTYEMRSIASEGLVPDPGFLAHFVEHSLTLYAMQKIANRTYAIKDIIVEMDVCGLSADSKYFQNVMQSDKMNWD